MAVIGYARVSSSDQDLSVQIDQLKAAGCTRIFSEKKSGVSIKERGELEACLQYVRDGDIMVITRIDRMARSVRDFANIISQLDAKGVGFKCLLQPFDSTSPSGRLMRDMLAAFAEFETSVRAERQREGIEKAKAKGVYDPTRQLKGGGTTAQRATVGRHLSAGMSYAQTAEKTGISDDTIRRWFPQYNKRPYSRAGSRTKVPRRAKAPLFVTVDMAKEPVQFDTPETIEKKMGFLKGILGRARGQI